MRHWEPETFKTRNGKRQHQWQQGQQQLLRLLLELPRSAQASHRRWHRLPPCAMTSIRRHMANAINSHSHNWKLATAAPASSTCNCWLCCCCLRQHATFSCSVCLSPPLSLSSVLPQLRQLPGLPGLPWLVIITPFCANVYFNNVAENFYFQFFTSQWS